jgi:hypothetical protein
MIHSLIMYVKSLYTNILLRTNARDVGGNNSFMQDDTRDYTNYTNQGEQPTVLTDSG